jgi:hypothetical protein
MSDIAIASGKTRFTFDDSRAVEVKLLLTIRELRELAKGFDSHFAYLDAVVEYVKTKHKAAIDADEADGWIDALEAAWAKKKLTALASMQITRPSPASTASTRTN